MSDRAAAAKRGNSVQSDDRGAATRNRVLEAAARHFAEHTFSGTSLRAIQREVGVNPATIHYYFGAKEALYQAVISPPLEHIQAERVARLRRIPEKLAGRARLERLLHAYLGPHLEFATTPSGYDYARILAFVQVSGRDAAAELFDLAVAPVRKEFANALAPLFPQAPKRRMYEALAMAVADMAMVPIRLADKSLDKRRMALATEDCVAYAAGGFERLCGPIAK